MAIMKGNKFTRMNQPNVPDGIYKDSMGIYRSRIKRSFKKFPDNEMTAEALRKSKGFISVAAKLLGINQESLRSRLKKDIYLAQTMYDVQERHVDITEMKLLKRIRKYEDMDAIKFHLTHKGKSRGYGKDASETSPFQVNLVIEADRLRNLSLEELRTLKELSSKAVESSGETVDADVKVIE